MGWMVKVIEYDTDGKVVKALGPYDSERIAMRADHGLNRQLDHERFYTMVEEDA